MKFSKDLQSSGFLYVCKISISYLAPFRPLKRMTCPSQKLFFSRVLTDQKCQDTFLQNGRVYTSIKHQMKAYDEKCLLGVLTLNDLGMTQGQGQACQIFTI